jgi:hypothetical protein
MSKPLYDDPVVAEIHAIRAKMLADCDGDHRRLMEQIRAHEAASDRQVIAPPPPPVEARSTEQRDAAEP